MILYMKTDPCPLTEQIMPIGDRDKHCSKICPFGGFCKKKNRFPWCEKEDRNCVCTCNVGRKFDTVKDGWAQWLLKEKPVEVKDPCREEEEDAEATTVRRQEVQGSERPTTSRIRQSSFWTYGRSSPGEKMRDENTAEPRELEQRKSEHEKKRRERDSEEERDKRHKHANLACDIRCPPETNGNCADFNGSGARRCFCRRKEDAQRTGSKMRILLPLASARAMWWKGPCDPTFTLFTDYCERACPNTMRGLCLREDGMSHGDFCFCYEHEETERAMLSDRRGKCHCIDDENLDECLNNCLTSSPLEYTPSRTRPDDDDDGEKQPVDCVATQLDPTASQETIESPTEEK